MLCSVAILVILALNATNAQFGLPPPPSPRRFSSGSTPSNRFSGTTRNSFYNRINQGSWLRTNFQDLFSYENNQNFEWFEILETADCNPTPATVNAGRPPRDLCKDATVDERRCICINTSPRSDTYEKMCGICRDPCALKFTPDRVSNNFRQRISNGYDFNDY